jgi:hypothetical protein
MHAQTRVSSATRQRVPIEPFLSPAEAQKEEAREQKREPLNDRGSWQVIRASAQQLRTAARTMEPGVLSTLHEEEDPTRLRSIATHLLDCTLEFLNEIVSVWGVSGQKKRRYNQTFEAAVRAAVRRRLPIGDLAEFVRTELGSQRARLDSSSVARCVLILDCANAISGVRTTAAALEAIASREQRIVDRAAAR